MNETVVLCENITTIVDSHLRVSIKIPNLVPKLQRFPAGQTGILNSRSRCTPLIRIASNVTYCVINDNFSKTSCTSSDCIRRTRQWRHSNSTETRRRPTHRSHWEKCCTNCSEAPFRQSKFRGENILCRKYSYPLLPYGNVVTTTACYTWTLMYTRTLFSSYKRLLSLSKAELALAKRDVILSSMYTLLCAHRPPRWQHPVPVLLGCSSDTIGEWLHRASCSSNGSWVLYLLTVDTGSCT